MSKVRPQAPTASTSSKQEIFTIWMKSLILSGNGCTVFNSRGQIVYRVDNYNHKSSNEVCLMDIRGKVLFTILRRVANDAYKQTSFNKICTCMHEKKFLRQLKFKLQACWEGYRAINTDVYTSTYTDDNKGKPGFQVRKNFGVVRGYALSKVVVGLDNNQPFDRYKMESWTSKSSCKIVDSSGELVAEVQRKRSTCGVNLGADVWAMVVEPNVDLTLVMGLIVVHGLINNKL
ncbi:hypothetical protein RJ639_043920 [Escallonia herrerae]|uniref:Uncharacterized protein n=1 Tax=Escallonia herrerae TaxID=1293975 RepID=A0AA89B467_9ASTE|nr:hypothetical protein RJ639_043920 [Escallonia herrerae]